MRCPCGLALSFVLATCVGCATGSSDEVVDPGGTGYQAPDGGATPDGSRVQSSHDASTPPPAVDASTPPPDDDAATPPPDDDAGVDATTPPPVDAAEPPPPVDSSTPTNFCDTSSSVLAAYYGGEYANEFLNGDVVTCDGTTGAGCGSSDCCYIPSVGLPGCVSR